MMLDHGSRVLIDDLKSLIQEAQKGQFGDFTSDYATPKMELANKLLKLRENVLNGRYD